MENKKNYDPKMHTAEHVLNGTMVQMFNTGRAFSAHLEKKKSKCDYHFSRDLTEDEIIQLQKKVNEVLASDLEVTEEFLTREDAEKTFNLSRLPEDSGDVVRIIRVGDYDACPCSGPHVGSTKETGWLRIISHDFNDGILRIRFKLDAY